MAKEVYPNITWAVEASKVMTGSEWQMGSASMIRSMKAELDIMRQRIGKGEDPTVVFDAAEGWLARCLYSANMQNFK